VTYLEEDIWHFVNRAPYLALSRPVRAVSFLERQLSLRAECFTRLDAYPELQVEPLEFFYRTARSLGMLDRQSLQDLLTAHTWRGVVWGGWLALMAPSPDLAEVLSRASAQKAENLWPVQCALALLEGRAPPAALAHVGALAARVRDAMLGMRVPRMPLRSSPTAVERAVLDEERRLVRAAYVAGGVDRARQVLKGTRIEELSMPYARWYAAQRRRG
jgi:hypothetical protein